MKRFALVLPLVAALGGCGLTSEMLQDDVRIGVGVIRAVGCSVQAVGGFGNAIVQVGSEAACRAAGGTVVAR